MPPQLSIQRYRFSIRFLLAVMAVAALLLSALRFGPHVWFASTSGRSVVHSYAAIPLVAIPLDEKLIDCRLGAFAFQLPASMCQAVDVLRGTSGAWLRFSDGNRKLLVNLNPSNDFDWFPNGFPEKKYVTYTELAREVESNSPHPILKRKGSKSKGNKTRMRVACLRGSFGRIV